MSCDVPTSLSPLWPPPPVKKGNGLAARVQRPERAGQAEGGPPSFVYPISVDIDTAQKINLVDLWRSEVGHVTHVLCDITKEVCPFWLQGATFSAKILFVSFQQTSRSDWPGSRYHLIGENLKEDSWHVPETLSTQRRHLL